MRLIIAALAACLVASPARAGEPAGPDCLTPSTAMANAMAHGSVVGRLDGAEATELLARINAIEPPTSYRAETLVILLRPDRAIVAMFGICHEGDVVIGLDAFAAVWRAVRGSPA